MWNDFGRMWKKSAIEKWQAIKVGQLTLSVLYTKRVWEIGDSFFLDIHRGHIPSSAAFTRTVP